ncbi:MAG TPA: hypothetical protein GXX30_11185 [Firmicutes bacterium]|nr:hypothetical protein [Candidatus Fermentithermobacillaceae bacterium]
MKRTLPYIISLIAACIIILGAFFNIMPKGQEELDKWYILSSSAACAIGLVNLTAIHSRNIRRRNKDWDLSILLLVITYGYLIFGLFAGPDNETYSWIFNATAVPLGSTFYSLLGFYIVSAAYRAFRAKTREAAILLGAAVIVLLGRAPLGEVIWAGFGTWTKWIMDIPNTAAMRAVMFGATLGSFITAIRIFLGFDRPYASAGE